jgi:outer membrane protein TolC
LLLSLVVTPVAYSLLDDLSHVRLRLWTRAGRAAAATAGAMLLALAIPGRADAQPPAAPVAQPAAPSVSAAQPPSSAAAVVQLTAEQAVQMATANNPDLVAGGYDPRIATERVAQARAAFLPTFESSLQRNVQQAPATSVFFGTQGVRTDLWSGDVGFAQRLPWGGGSYNVLWNSARTNASSTLSNFNPSVTASVQGVLSQPLLRDFKIDPFRAQVTTAQRSSEIADIGLQELATTVTTAAERAYWNLVLANAAVGVQQQSLDLSLELERTNRARVDVGQSPPLDLVSAQAEVAQRRENLIVAQTQARQAEDQLRILVLDPARPDYWSVRLQPGDIVPPVGPVPDVDAAVRNALNQRTDLQRTKKQIQIADTQVSLAHNQVLPDVRLNAEYLTNGLGGTELLRTGGFPGTVSPGPATAYGDVLRQVFASDYPTWTVGVTVSYPLGHSADQAALVQSQLSREQSLARLRSAELHVVRDVRQAALDLDQNRQRIDTTRAARELEAQRLDAEQKRYEVGMSTNFNVIQAQRDLAVARNNELQAQLDYQLALINFETVQKVGPSSGTTTGAATVSSGTVIIPATSATTTTTGATVSTGGSTTTGSTSGTGGTGGGSTTGGGGGGGL